MKILTNLTATVIEGSFEEPPCHHHHVGEHHEIPNGDKPPMVYARALRVGPKGIILINGTHKLVIPKEELWKLAEKYEPNLGIPIAITPSPVANRQAEDFARKQICSS